MQLFLANSYFVCQMYMNEAISALDLIGYQKEAFKQAARLIESEIPHMYPSSEAKTTDQTNASDQHRNGEVGGISSSEQQQ